MRNRMRRLLLLGLLISMAAPRPLAYAAGTIKPSDKVQAAIERILDAQLAALNPNSQSREFELGKRVEKVLEDQSQTGDESLVVLLSFYIGESNGGDLLHEITLRGKRMLPILAKYKNETVVLKHGTRFAKLRMPLKIRRENFSEVIGFIRKGKVWGID